MEINQSLAVKSKFNGQMQKLLSETSLKSVHWKVWFLSAMGIFLDGYDLFIISVALPLIAKEFNASPALQGLIGGSAVLGMMIGACLGGRMTDRLGRKAIYIIDIFIFIVFTICSSFSWSISSLIFFRFFLGIGIGADYPICASYISEFMPARLRGKMLISAFSFQAFGMISAALVGLLALTLIPTLLAWRWMLATGALPAFIILLFRTKVFESPLWLLAHKKNEEALKVISALTGTQTEQLQKIKNEYTKETILEPSPGYTQLFKNKFIRQTILSCVPWFLMDIATYGVGIFTPIILATFFAPSPTGTIASVFSSVAGAAFLDIFLILGFFLNILFIERWGRINLQIIGFAGMAVGLLVLIFTSISETNSQHYLFTVFLGFAIFNLLMNAGPNATTFTIPAEVFPTSLRASGHGLAAAFAKLGAFLGIFLLPIFKGSFGLSITLIFLAIICLLGLLFTFIFQIETKGKILS